MTDSNQILNNLLYSMIKNMTYTFVNKYRLSKNFIIYYLNLFYLYSMVDKKLVDPLKTQ